MCILSYFVSFKKKNFCLTFLCVFGPLQPLFVDSTIALSHGAGFFFFYLMTNVGIQITTIVSKEENSKSLPQKCCCQSSKQEIKKIKTENVSTMRGRGERERESSFQSVHTLAEMAPRYGDSTRFWANPFQSRTVRGQKGSSLHDVQSCKRWYAWLCLLLSALPACQACVNIEEYVRGDCLSSFLEC